MLTQGQQRRLWDVIFDVVFAAAYNSYTVLTHPVLFETILSTTWVRHS
ncbi:hypothetical protein VCHA44O286_50350 [Vibrio chagasii]|nr:hypothetical protein VCHA44O286_50350 [Vibrio chagasii]